METLENILPKVWDRLSAASADAQDPLRFPALAVYPSEASLVRTVVLREVNATLGELIFYTDVRSPKMNAIRLRPKVEWLFHDLKQRTQVRALADAFVHTQDDLARKKWLTLPAASRRSYATFLAPGTPLPNGDASGPPEIKRAKDGFDNFAVIRTEVMLFDWLLLDENGNSRAIFRREGDEFSGQWVVP